MDTSSKRKFSLDSKSSSGHYDLRFTRQKLNNNYKWCCCGIASFLLMLLLAASAVYFAYYSMSADGHTLISFRANFRVTAGDTFDANLIDTNSTWYREKSRSYRELINLLVRRSEHRRGFVGSEILALDGVEDSGMSVHLKLHFDSERTNVTTEALRTFFHSLFNGSSTSRSERFNQLTIDPHSLYIGEPGISEFSLLPTTLEVTGAEGELTTEVSTEPPRVCVTSQLEYCKHDNFTSYPNIFGHVNPQQVRSDIVRFREIVDSECYPEGAYEFVCQLLQPECGEQGELVLPCRSECANFMTQCEQRLPDDIKTLFVCDEFSVDC